MEIELKEISVFFPLALHILGFWDSREISPQDTPLSFLLG